MAKIKINGDSSGYVEIAAPNAAHNNTLELGPGTKILTDKNTHTGNIGIGTDNPQDPLDVASAVPQIRLTDTSDGSYGQIRANGGNLILRADEGNTIADSVIVAEIDGGEKLRVSSDGNVLVGTANTTAINSGPFSGETPKVEIRLGGASNSYTRLLNISNPGAQSGNETLGRVGIKFSLGGESNSGESNKSGIIYAESTSAYNNTTSLCFATSNSERLRITSGGELILTPGADSGNILQLNGADTTSELLEAGITSGHVQFTATHASGGSNTCGFIFRTRTGSSGTTEKLRITSGGQVNIGGDLSQTGFTANITRNSSETDILRIKGNAGNAFIRFQDNDSSSNYTIGADDAVGGGGFMVYDRNASAYRLVLSNGGNLGIAVNTPFSRFQSGGHTFSGGHGMHSDGRVGMSNHGNLTGLMLASTYNDGAHPEYGLVFVQGPNTSSYNVWGVCPDGPNKGNSLNFHYAPQATNIHTPGYRKFQMTGEGYFLQSGQPKFRAGRSSNYSPGAGSDIIFDTVTGGGKHNVGGHYNAANGRFTAPVAGVYTFTAHVIWQSLSSGQNMADCFHIKINGVNVGYSGRRGEYIANETGNNGYYTDFMTYQLTLAAGDYVTIDNSYNLQVHGNSNYTTFSGHLVG